MTPDDAAGADFEVDAHGAQSSEPEDPEQTPAPSDVEDVERDLVNMGWTPEEATQLICAIWNFGMLVWGPEWAAHPAETAGWNISMAQLLDQFLPKGTGGFVQLGAGLIMVGNGIAMMGVRRIPLIQRGPRPMWVRKPAADAAEQVAQQPAPNPSRPSSNGSDGTYRLPRDLVPTDSSDVKL